MNRYNHYRIGSYFLIGFAPLLILAALLTDPIGYLQSPFLMLSATSFIGGSFLFALSGDKSIDAWLASMFSVQGISALGRMIRDQGGCGAAVFLPSENKEGGVMQFTPIRADCRTDVTDEGQLAYHNGNTGTLTPALAAPLLEKLKQDNDLTLPKDYSHLMGAIREVCEDLLSIADQVDIKREGNTATFNLHNYLLLSGCISLRKASPDICVLYPCSICSLIACMITEGLGCEVSLHRVTLDDTGRSPFMSLQYTLMAGTEVPDFKRPTKSARASTISTHLDGAGTPLSGSYEHRTAPPKDTTSVASGDTDTALYDQYGKIKDP